ncbi:TetR/AcrR family transcriptional regulator [Mycobacterium sp. DBP42]|uniref:TetR/AcrR family transcriptional regulator n=1 Tax=Mycobacterium sp. DBP42 TaxID=2545267 RepID=UPI00352F6D9A
MCKYGGVVEMVEKVDLRLRRRRQTTAEVRETAVRLMSERGFDKVTIEEICSEVGISQRTFFNYFPNKESSIAYNPFDDLPTQMIDDFTSAQPAPAATVLTELIALLSHELASAPGRAQAAAMLNIAATTPAVRAALLAEMESFESRLAQLVAQRMGVPPGDNKTALISALALATVRCGLQRWISSDVSAPSDTPVPHVQHTAQLLHEIFTA